ncbi:hypothetical protein HAP94_06225 [Acidithiobacillus ferrivorans]|nr:hypothetical protein [Acidithiobacillus ferrivorans]
MTNKKTEGFLTLDKLLAEVEVRGRKQMRKLTSDEFVMLRSLDKEDFHPRYGGVLWKHNKKWCMICRNSMANEFHDIISRAIDSASCLEVLGLVEVVNTVRGECGECFEPYFKLTKNGRAFLARCNHSAVAISQQTYYSITYRKPKHPFLSRVIEFGQGVVRFLN